MTAPPLSNQVIIAGCVRDTAASLPSVLRNIEAIAANFQQCEVVICENDSRDSSLSILHSWRDSCPLPVTILSSHLSLVHRVRRIAWARNRILDHIRSSHLGSYDHLIMMDMDGVNSRVSARGVLSGFTSGEEWDVLTANQPDYYYDHFALRTPRYDLNPYSPSERYKWINGTNLKYFFDTEGSDQSRIPHKRALIPVLSAFGGLAIYRLGLFEGLRYEPAAVLDEKGNHFLHPITGIEEFECEHVDMHAKMRAKSDAKIYINARMLNRGLG